MMMVMIIMMAMAMTNPGVPCRDGQITYVDILDRLEQETKFKWAALWRFLGRAAFQQELRIPLAVILGSTTFQLTRQDEATKGSQMQAGKVLHCVVPHPDHPLSCPPPRHRFIPSSSRGAIAVAYHLDTLMVFKPTHLYPAENAPTNKLPSSGVCAGGAHRGDMGHG